MLEHKRNHMNASKPGTLGRRFALFGRLTLGAGFSYVFYSGRGSATCSASSRCRGSHTCRVPGADTAARLV